ncbi:MAG: hypothetical protein QNJ36_16210 [Calothrix sp. MO_167.B42]|nr:hypothetical protein [Calothrix sp. MO_167.B42]
MKSKQENSQIQIKVAIIGGFFVIIGAIIAIVPSIQEARTTDDKNPEFFKKLPATRIDCQGNSQKCGKRHKEIIEVKNKGKLYITHLDHLNHCGKFDIQTYINGEAQKLIKHNENQNLVEIGHIKEGSNTLELEAKGITGGCNRGKLNSWTMNLELYTSNK